MKPRASDGLRGAISASAAVPQAAVQQTALPWIGFAVRLLAAAIWLFSGIAKLPDLQGFRLEVARYGLLPGFLVAPFAYVLPFLELGLGIYFSLGLFVRGAAFAGTLLFASFIFAQGWALANGIVLDCGCFGPVLKSTVSPLTIIRDFSLGIPTFLMLAFPARAVSLDARLFDAQNLFGGASRMYRNP